MRFQILHESAGRLHLRADVSAMSIGQADLLDAWIRGQQGVESDGFFISRIDRQNKHGSNALIHMLPQL